MSCFQVEFVIILCKFASEFHFEMQHFPHCNINDLLNRLKTLGF